MSNEVKTKEKVNMDPKYIIKLTVTLFATCVIVAGLLGLVNMVTKDKIAAINWENTQTAMKAVVADPDNTEFSEALENTDAMSAAAKAAGGTLDSVYEVLVGGENAGYAIKVVASGSQGNIEMMVGVDAEGVVTGVSIVDNSETSGIGSKVMSNEPLSSGVGVLDQFQGKSAAADGTLTVGKNVDAISGATVSSKGVTAGVNAALAVAGAIG
ncbi:MAG: RnfABCDGE type electron transport complex subunit G [Dysosmobacter sp.]|nr:RnfABCDGE type electron transport complex subunit G [Dysosmobacter sp.]